MLFCSGKLCCLFDVWLTLSVSALLMFSERLQSLSQLFWLYQSLSLSSLKLYCSIWSKQERYSPSLTLLSAAQVWRMPLGEALHLFFCLNLTHSDRQGFHAARTDWLWLLCMKFPLKMFSDFSLSFCDSQRWSDVVYCARTNSWRFPSFYTSPKITSSDLRNSKRKKNAERSLYCYLLNVLDL